MPVLPDSDSPAPSPVDTIPWVPADDLTCTPSPSGVITAELIANAATIIADNLSGNQFGQRNLKLRPRALTPDCHCRIGCRCGTMTSIILTETVWTISTVKVDGAVLASDAWTLYDDNSLVRTDGGGFPCCQDRARNPDTDTHTLEIVGVFGTPPNEMAQLAVQEIACELVQAFDNPASCRLPKRTQSVVRQQLTVNVQDGPTVLAEGFTGLPTVDLWLGSLDAASRRHTGRAIDLSMLNAYRINE